MANFIIPSDEFFASVGEPGDDYANSMEQWRERSMRRQAAWKAQERRLAGIEQEHQRVRMADLMQRANILTHERLLGLTLPQSNNLTLQECPKCECFHLGECGESADRLPEGDGNA
jgi:hypothetical protein